MSSSLNHLVANLAGTNYSNWAKKMKMVLTKDVLWPIVREKHPHPERPAQEARQ
jgi:hypothetical protein